MKVVIKVALRRILTAAAIGAFALTAAIPASADQTEDQIGAQVYQQLAQKGEIINSSPDYNMLNPIAKRIKAVVDSQYDRPFRFILVHESQPNAFSVPGGNVYVTDALLKFVKNKEELAGVLCHETSHTIHHDVVNNMKKDQNLSMLATGLSLLLGGRGGGLANAALSMGANLQALNFSREVETAADLKGSETCAEAGYNPWGMVWLFKQFEKADTGGKMEMLSDHPNDDHRIADLERHFKQNPALFGKFSSDIATATPLAEGYDRYATAPQTPSGEARP
ncbi:MAG: M48 family metalloprotease [Candidatus Eremiobacteraeota bacterium]|nr:M48 family metalloprotease [Candidatus Eremiobacteraeota bacterium]MBV8355709.1 M48 family metalloprotease [Candidatus Eremiobacteraeota bacterium]